MAGGRGPEKSLEALGYAGWDAGQLEAEMLANSWLNVSATPDIVFDMPFADRWAAAAKALGVDLTLLSPEAGHA
jgi:putative transcriptional regulator